MIYLSLLAASFFINVDTGIFPAAVLQIEDDLKISEQEVAILNSVNVTVCGTLSIFAGPIFNNYKAKYVFILCGLLNSIGWFMFIATDNF